MASYVGNTMIAKWQTDYAGKGSQTNTVIRLLFISRIWLIGDRRVITQFDQFCNNVADGPIILVRKCFDCVSQAVAFFTTFD